MYDKNEILPQARSYTGVSDIFGSGRLSNFCYKNPYLRNKDQSISGKTTAESDKKSSLKNSAPVVLNETVYVTSEKYHDLNKNLSYKSIVRSSSTIFCDLDEIATRHSFHCLTEISISNANILKAMKLPINRTGFKGKTNALVQECATQIHPKLLAKDSMEINLKKVRNFPHNDVLSSEIFLRDSYNGKGKKQYYNTDVITNNQKIWSYAKYRTEYTKPISEERKNKKKDRGKRTEDPCPCQLFSYACPCSDEKSLCELAKNSKCLAVVNQITSTSKLVSERKTKQPHDCAREDKYTNTNLTEGTEAKSSQKTPIIEIADKLENLIPVLADFTNKYSPNKSIRTSHKKVHKVICPNCNEKVEVISNTEDEENLKLMDSSMCRSKELMSTYNCSTNARGNKCKAFEEADSCNHEPRCELVPVCQILPIEDVNVILNQKNSKKRTSSKSNPRVIRITKACRHHPPCTVVPSCQRANVLRNNCEYIPPCLHQPRCVNLPLCVPFSKSIYYDESCKQKDEEIASDSQKNNVDRRYNLITHVQNACELKNGNWAARPCCSSRSNKSCQYQCSEFDCVCSSHNNLNGKKRSASIDAIVFIRDVGCQFKTYSPKDLMTVRSKTSSASFNLIDVNARNYYTALHTLRCEDKFTNPKSEFESLSTDSMSVEVDALCPSHGRRPSKTLCTGFEPNQRYTTAFFKSSKIPSFLFERHKDLSKSDVARYRDSTFPVKSRRSFLKGKYRKIFAVRRKKKSKTSGHTTCASK